jgi:hypothetical protein
VPTLAPSPLPTPPPTTADTVGVAVTMHLSAGSAADLTQASFAAALSGHLAGADATKLRGFRVAYSQDGGARRRLDAVEVAARAARAALGQGRSAGAPAVVRGGGRRRLLGTATVTFEVLASLQALGFASADTFERALRADLEAAVEDGSFTAAYAVKEGRKRPPLFFNISFCVLCNRSCQNSICNCLFFMFFFPFFF